jgi:hypothetical protein
MGSLFNRSGGAGSPFLQHVMRTAIQKTSGAFAGGASTAPMPDMSSAGVTAVHRVAQQQLLSRAGRSPTILTAPDTRGGAYTATKLGSGS